MSKAVVYGGSGFLGSHVADALTTAGFNVVVYDIKPSPYLLTSQKMVVGDIRDFDKVVQVAKNATYVFNFAGITDIDEAKTKPLETCNLNIQGNLNILEAARLNQVKRFVLASSIYVYSNSGSFYRISKQACEGYTETYYEKYQVPFTILRYGSLYGPRSDHRNNIFRLVTTAITQKVIRYQGSGEELRDYIHVQDAAAATLEVLKPAFENERIVLTGQQSFRVKDVMRMIAEMLGNEIELQFSTEPVEAHYQITPYAYKPRFAKKLIINPFIDFGQGLLECIHDQDQNGREVNA